MSSCRATNAKMLTLDEALALVGVADAPVVDLGDDEEDEES